MRPLSHTDTSGECLLRSQVADCLQAHPFLMAVGMQVTFAGGAQQHATPAFGHASLRMFDRTHL